MAIDHKQRADDWIEKNKAKLQQQGLDVEMYRQALYEVMKIYGMIDAPSPNTTKQV